MTGIGIVVLFVLLMYACSPREEKQEQDEWSAKIEQDSKKYTDRWF
jgi:hypothetical protein